MIYRLPDDQPITVDTASASPTNSSEEDVCSSPELDVVSFTPGPQSSSSSAAADDPNNQKRYFCQRCLNHKLEFPRKGHKPFCRYAMCHCDDCMMVEYRRRLNNQLSQRRLDPDQIAAGKRADAGKKIRDPKCARCSAHGEKQALRGHKKALCPYLKCGCHLCNLVENRRTLMAKQIKLRRDQQKARKAQQAQGGEPTELKSSPVKPTKTAFRNPINGSFARPVTVGERKRSYDSMMDDSESPAANGQPSIGSISPPVMATDLTTGLTPMLLPPSLLYQQLCQRSLQQQQQQTGELNCVQANNLPSQNLPSITGSFNHTGSPSLAVGASANHTDSQLVKSLLLVNALTAQPQPSDVFTQPAAFLTSQPQPAVAENNNTTLVLQALNFFNISSALAANGSNSGGELSKTLLERLAAAVLSNGGASVSSNLSTSFNVTADELPKNIGLSIPPTPFASTVRIGTPPSPSSTLAPIPSSSPLANFLLQYSAALS